MDLAARISAWREAKGMSRQELAAHVGVSPAAVYHWEATDETAATPRQETLAKIVDAFGITLARFWGAIPSKKAS